jgi:type IV pilus assembly protein PilP
MIKKLLKKNSFFSAPAGILVCAVMLTACSKDQPVVESNKKDPFKPFVVVKVESKRSFDSINKTQHDSLPIHSFDVNQFKLIGIVSGGRENKAMVTDPGGKGYVLKVGMSIGKNNGKIVAINSNGVDVVEQFKDEGGKTRRETIKLTLPRKQ